MTDRRISPRETFAANQRQWLAPCAVGESDSGGRTCPEPEHDYRTCFQRDRDRILHCSAFRRLDYKTQVFVPHVQDHFRTRMTHTLEVAQIARCLARALRLNEDLTEAAALAHDLGHPPFGHAGEAALDELMADHGHFEHNRQSLRVVDYLEHPYPAYRGLNLTGVVRECLAKHTTRYDSPICDDFDLSLHAPAEGQLVDACDEIAFTSSDVDDALGAGWITVEQLTELQLWRLAWDRAEAAAPDARFIHKQIRATKAVVAVLADDLLATTEANLAATAPDSPAAVRHAAAKCVAFTPATAAALGELQDFLYANVYTHQASVIKSRESRRRIVDLFTLFTGRPESLPARYAGRVDTDGLHRVACDYIAGMTDKYCIQAHAKLCGR